MVRAVSEPDHANSERKAAARRKFDRWAGSYERDRRSRFNARRQREALAALELGRDDRLLDVGCGSGAAVRAAAETAQRSVGVDISAADAVAAGADEYEPLDSIPVLSRGAKRDAGPAE